MASSTASPLTVPPTTTASSSSFSAEPQATPRYPDSDSDSDPDDPVVESYHVLLKPELPAHQQLLVLQHPNRTSDYLGGATELRLKPGSGMVELDMPLGHAASYDRAKGVNWGKALAQAGASRPGGAHGLAGGFGVGAPALRITAAEAKAGGVGGGRRGGGAGADDDLEVVGGGVSAADFNEAVRRDKVLRTQTLGGQISTGDTQTRYMIGVFAGDNIHLTPITNLALLRPQLHHIDAKAELERATRRSAESNANGGGHQGSGSAGGGGGGGSGSGSGGPAPRAVHMTVKSAGAVESDDSGGAKAELTIADQLKAVQMEPWRRLAYVEDSADDAWAMYEESLVRRGLDMQPPLAPAPADEDDEGKGKGKEQAKAEAAGDDERLVDRVAALGTRWDETELLHVVSGLEVPRPGDENDGVDADGATATGPRGGARPKAGASRVTTMDLD